MYEQILYEVDDPVATITLNRPQSLERMDHAHGGRGAPCRVAGRERPGGGRHRHHRRRASILRRAPTWAT